MRTLDLRRVKLHDVLWLGSLSRLSLEDWPRLRRILVDGAGFTPEEADNITLDDFVALMGEFQRAIQGEREDATPFPTGGVSQPGAQKPPTASQPGAPS